MRDRADVVVIGGGIMGLAVAYNLAKYHGITDVVVLEASYLCSGASGRNGGGVRAQWSSEANIRLMQESLEVCREFAREHRINTWFRQGGYLFLVRDEERKRSLEVNVKLQNDCGVKTRMLDSHGAREDRSGAVGRRRSRCLLQRRRRRGVPVALRVGLRRRRPGPGRGGSTVHAGDRNRDDQRRGQRGGDRARHHSHRLRAQCHRRPQPGARADGGRSSCRITPTATRSAPASRSSPGSARWWRTCPMGCTSPSPPGERSSGASATEAVPEGPNQDSSNRFLALYSRALMQVIPRLGVGEDPAPVGRTVRHQSRTPTPSSGRSTAWMASSSCAASWATAS